MLPISYTPSKNTQRITQSLPAPVKGLNSISPLAEMDPNFSIQCNNFVASRSGLTPRQGYYQWATGIPTDITSLIPYNSKSGSSNKLFAVAGGDIYDVTLAGAVGTPVVTGLTSSWCQYIQQTVTAGSTTYLIVVNGVDAPYLYNGSTWTPCSQTAGGGGPGVFSTLDQNGNAIDINAFVDCALYEGYLFFCMEGSTIAYYTGFGACGGQLYAFDFGQYFPRGGYLQKLATWTMDFGGLIGTKNVLVGISNKGDVVVYQGTDPNSASSWSLQGYWQLGAPVGQRCTTMLNGDLAYLSKDGLFTISKYLQSTRVDTSSALTYQISPTINGLISSYGTQKGWEVIIYPGNNLLLLNAPATTQADNIQFCFQTTNSAWTSFSGWSAGCWALFNDQLYFGGTGYVGLAFQGYTDGADYTGTGGVSIPATCLQAYSNFNFPGLKQVKAVKPFFLTSSVSPTLQVGINTDFNVNPITATSNVITPPTGSLWDVGLWDTATWGTQQITYNEWATPTSFPGMYVSLAIAIQTSAALTWTATSFVMTAGQMIG